MRERYQPAAGLRPRQTRRLAAELVRSRVDVMTIAEGPRLFGVSLLTYCGSQMGHSRFILFASSQHRREGLFSGKRKSFLGGHAEAFTRLAYRP